MRYIRENSWSVDTDRTIRRLSWFSAWVMPVILTIAVSATIPLPF
jgi:hypothetical protein